MGLCFRHKAFALLLAAVCAFTAGCGRGENEEEVLLFLGEGANATFSAGGKVFQDPVKLTKYLASQSVSKASLESSMKLQEKDIGEILQAFESSRIEIEEFIVPLSEAPWKIDLMEVE